MTNINLEKIKEVFFIGIGGIGISAIARMMLLEGKDVSGSDISESNIINELKKLGAKIITGQGMELIPKDVDLIVYTVAIPKYDSEFFKKLKNNFQVPMLSYPQMLGIVTAGKYTIAVSGTHGKTTTTAMIAKILIDTHKDPSVIVGSLLKDYKSNLV
ncbi:MAG TPA: Mur ligase domain-containing protein, partial [Candidatus Paceibacterota bacterium]|nr:Mur ligase domain-containing protein [Candidatus Paceibacterota bacterium]